MRRFLAALLAVSFAAACRDFDEGLTKCAINRICTDGQNSEGFSLTLSPAELTLSGAGFSRTQLGVTYPPNFFSRIALRLEGAADAGLVAVFIPNEIGAFDNQMPTLDVRADAVATAPQTWTLDVVGTQPDGGDRMRAALKITVTPGTASTLVVDDDHSDNNFNAGNDIGITLPAPKASPSDVFYAAGLNARGTAFDTWIQPETTWDGGNGPLTLAQIQKYTSIVWYTDRSYQESDNITAGDDFALRHWLDLGNRRLVLLSENYVGYQVPLAWDMVGPDKELAANYVGVVGGAARMSVVANGQGYDLSGVGGQTTGGLTFRLPFGANETNLSLINPRPGTQPLLTVRGDPDSTAEREIALATVRRNVGDAGTSTVVYVGFALVDVAPNDGGTREVALKALLDSAGF